MSFRSSSLRPAKVFAVEFDQIEGAEHGGVVAKPIMESVEYREAAFVDDDGLAVDDARSHRQARDRVGDLREARREIVTIAGEQPHAFGVPPRNDAEAVVLDLVNPARPAGGSFAGRGRHGSSGRGGGGAFDGRQWPRSVSLSSISPTYSLKRAQLNHEGAFC